MSLNIGRILDPAGLIIKDKPQKQQNNITNNITNNYYGNQGLPDNCKHKPPGQGGMNPEKMMQMFGMMMQLCQAMTQGQGQDQNNGSFASAQASNGNSFAFAQAGTFNMVS